MEISIIIPIYNKKQYLFRLLEMICEQSFTDFECLLIDDGSTDGSEKICDEYCKRDKRFHVLHISNGGVSHARNIGLEKAKGRYITFIDGDDEIHNDYLKNLYQCIEEKKVDLVIGCYQKIYDNAIKRETIVYPIEYRVYKMDELLPIFCNLQKRTGVFGWCWAKMFTATLVRNIRFDENIKLAEDFEFYLRLYPDIRTIYFDDKPYYYYRQQAENSSMLVGDEDIDYLTQLEINLRYRTFLQHMKGFSGANKQIVEKQIDNYVFFSLFHCSFRELSRRFGIIIRLDEERELPLVGDGLLQKWFFCLVRWRSEKLMEMTLKSYRYLRKVIKHRGI